MRKSIYFLLIITSVIIAQTDKKDPLQGSYTLGNSSEIAISWNVNRDFDSTVTHKIFNYLSNSGQYILDSTNRGDFNQNLGIGNKKKLQTISGDFDGDGLDEIITAWESSDFSINLVSSKINKNNLSWNDVSEIRLEKIQYPLMYNNSTRFEIIKGNFDIDSDLEFAICFWNAEANLEIRIYDIDENLNFLQTSVLADEYMNPNMYNNAILFDLACGDFDGDLIDEFVLAGHIAADANNWSIFTKIYDIQNSSIIPKIKKSDFYSSSNYFDSNYRINNFILETGDLTNNTIDEFILNFVLANTGSSKAENYILPAKVTLGLDTIDVDFNNLYRVFQTNGNTNLAISMQLEDLNNDGADEVIVDGDGRIEILQADTTLDITWKTGENFGSETPLNNRMIIADLNASSNDSLWHPEIIVAFTRDIEPDNFPDYATLNITVFEPIVDASGDIINVQERVSFIADSVKGSNNHIYSITAGDFDGGSIRLGKPNFYSATDIVQPLVILNAPPVHFDMFDGNIFDINKNFNGQTSNFYSKYFTSSETDIEFETKINKAWSVSGEVSGGFKVPVIGIGTEIKIKSQYGKGFSKKKFTSNIYKVSQNITASSDDYIYATIIDYDIWEYPVLTNDEIQGYVLVVEPGQPQRSWFPSKSPQAADYIPNHEVGNILSYNDIAAPTENGSLQQVVKWNTSDQITLDGSPGFQYNWALENETQTISTATNEVNFKISGEASFDNPFKFTPDVKIKGNYSTKSISTRTNKVKYKKGLDVHLGPIDLGIGETYYSVTPYAYWAKSGALVLDYAVDPRPSGINVPETWWQQKYSEKPDVALILPWRLDPEKGFSITDDKRQQTKDIIFNPEKPKPGEVINIKTRIRNFSLLNTNSIIDAKFYVGDPNNGGTLIESTDGKTIFSTDDFIPARGEKIISFDWQVPNGISTFPRIYVDLDPENKVEEIHETNNIGWKVLQLFDSTTDVEFEENLPTQFELSQNYPNPFNPTTTIKYSIPNVASSFSSSKVELKVFDVLGREIVTLVNQKQKPGNYEIQFDASNLSSGVYFYRLQSGGASSGSGQGFVQTKKMLLMK